MTRVPSAVPCQRAQRRCQCHQRARAAGLRGGLRGGFKVGFGGGSRGPWTSARARGACMNRYSLVVVAAPGRYCTAAQLREARQAFLSEKWASVADKLGSFVGFKITDGLLKMYCRFIRVLDKNTEGSTLSADVTAAALARSNADVASSLHVKAVSTGGANPLVRHGLRSHRRVGLPLG